MALNATLVDKRATRKCDVVAPVVVIDVSAAVEPQDEDNRGSGHSADFDAPQLPGLDGAREVNKSRQQSGNREMKTRPLSLASCSVVYYLLQSAHNCRPTSCSDS